MLNLKTSTLTKTYKGKGKPTDKNCETVCQNAKDLKLNPDKDTLTKAKAQRQTDTVKQCVRMLKT